MFFLQYFVVEIILRRRYNYFCRGHEGVWWTGDVAPLVLHLGTGRRLLYTGILPTGGWLGPTADLAICPYLYNFSVAQPASQSLY